MMNKFAGVFLIVLLLLSGIVAGVSLSQLSNDSYKIQIHGVINIDGVDYKCSIKGRMWIQPMAEQLMFYYNTGDDNQGTVIKTAAVDNRYAQSFTCLNKSAVLTKIRMKGWTQASYNNDNLHVELQTTNADLSPTGVILTSGTLDLTAVTTSSPGEWYTVEMTPYTMQSNVKYSIVLRLYDDNNLFFPRSNSVAWYLQDGVYHVAWAYGVSGWSSTVDCMMFEVWGTFPPSVHIFGNTHINGVHLAK